MGANLDLDDVVAGHPLAEEELRDLREYKRKVKHWFSLLNEKHVNNGYYAIKIQNLANLRKAIINDEVDK